MTAPPSQPSSPAQAAGTPKDGVGLGPATAEEMWAAIREDWQFDAIHAILTGRGTPFWTAQGFEQGHTLHAVGVHAEPYPGHEKLFEAEAQAPVDPHASMWVIGSSDINSQWRYGNAEYRMERVAAVLSDLCGARTHVSRSNALSWSPQRVAEGGSFLKCAQRLSLAMWWDERMASGYTPKDAQVMLALLLHPATAALISYPDDDPGRPHIRYPDDPSN